MIFSKASALRLLNGHDVEKTGRSGVEIPDELISQQRNGFYYMTPKNIRIHLEIEKIEKEIINHNEAGLIGHGFFSSVKAHIHRYGEKIINVIKKHIQPTLLEAFKTAANLYRSQRSDISRPLDLGELHPGFYNFMGPNTNYEKHKNTKPINDLDALAKEHDKAYYDSKRLPVSMQAQAIQAADKKFTNELNNHWDHYKHLPFASYALRGIESKHGVELLLSLFKGHPSVLFGGALPQYIHNNDLYKMMKIYV